MPDLFTNVVAGNPYNNHSRCLVFCTQVCIYKGVYRDNVIQTVVRWYDGNVKRVFNTLYMYFLYMNYPFYWCSQAITNPVVLECVIVKLLQCNAFTKVNDAGRDTPVTVKVLGEE